MPTARRTATEVEAGSLILDTGGGQTMAENAPILLFIGDRPVLSSLEFALALDGFPVADGSGEAADPTAASCLVVDQGYRDDGIGFLAELRERGCTAPAILLVTDLSPALKLLAEAIEIVPIEKPLLGEELTQALCETLSICRDKGLVA